jgi:hypothetical protein
MVNFRHDGLLHLYPDRIAVSSVTDLGNFPRALLVCVTEWTFIANRIIKRVIDVPFYDDAFDDFNFSIFKYVPIRSPIDYN